MKRLSKLFILLFILGLVIPSYILPIADFIVYAEGMDKYTRIQEYENTDTAITIGVGDRVRIKNVEAYSFTATDLIDAVLSNNVLTITGKSLGDATVSLNGGISEVTISVVSESIYENPYSDVISYDDLESESIKTLSVGDKIVFNADNKTVTSNKLDFIKFGESEVNYLTHKYYVIEVTGYGKNTLELTDGMSTKKIQIDSGIDTYFDQVYNSISREKRVMCNINNEIPNGFKLITNNQTFDSEGNYYVYNLIYSFNTLTGPDSIEKEFNFTCYYREAEPDNYISLMNSKFETGTGTLVIRDRKDGVTNDLNTSDYIIVVDDTSILTVDPITLEYNALVPGTTKLHVTNRNTLEETVFDITVNASVDYSNKETYFAELSSLSNTTQTIAYRSSNTESITEFFYSIAKKYNYNNPSVTVTTLADGKFKVVVRTGINNKNITISNLTANFYGASVKDSFTFARNVLNNYAITNLVSIRNITSPSYTYEYDNNYLNINTSTNRVSAVKPGSTVLKVKVTDPGSLQVFDLSTTLYINPSVADENELESKLANISKLQLPITELECNNDLDLLKRTIKNELLNQIGNLDILEYLNIDIQFLLNNHVIITLSSNKENYNFRTTKQLSYAYSSVDSSLVFNYDDLLDNIKDIKNLSLDESIDIVSSCNSDDDITARVKSMLLEGTSYTAELTLKDKKMVLNKLLSSMIYHVKVYNGTYLLYEEDLTVNFDLLIPYNKRTDKTNLKYVENYFNIKGRNVVVAYDSNNIYKITENSKDYYVYLNVVGEEISGIDISKSSVDIEISKTYQIEASVLPSNAYNTYLSYEVVDPSIADVTTNGLVMAKKKGSTKVIIKTLNESIYKEVAINVVDIKTTGISFCEEEIEIANGWSKETTINVYPYNTTEVNTFKYWTDDVNVAIIDNGIIRTVGSGSTYVYAKSSTGFTTKMKVVVYDPIPENSALRFEVIGVKNKAYNGKKQTQKIKVYLNGKKLKYKKDYKIKYVNNKKIGVATIKIIGINNYVDTKELTFKIRPQKIKTKKITSNKTSIKVNWKKQSKIDGYQVKYRLRTGEYVYTNLLSLNNKFRINDLLMDTKYDVKVRSYKYLDDQIIYGYWSKLRSKRTK